MAVAVLLVPAAAIGQVPPPATPPTIETDAAYHRLDFWLGDWEVTASSGNQREGHDRVEKVLRGAAIVEHWSAASGGEGKSWFYYYRPEKRWKQVWVTDGGFVKEKALVEEFADGGVRFRGEVQAHDGTRVLDQTTLTPLPGGKVHQVIETSRDGGKSWVVGFDAVYTHGQNP
jgi:hypothetical protein